jgi:hypothetical protein
MTEWANYDIDAKRVPPSSKRAAFRAKEVSIDTGVRAPPGHASLAGVEYRDGHAIDRSELRKTFKSFSMQRWFTEHAAGAKGRTQSDANRMPVVLSAKWEKALAVSADSACDVLALWK